MTAYPQNCVGGLAREISRIYCALMEAPRQFFEMAVLTCLGAAISDRITLDTLISPQPRLYAVLIGTSGNTRKSESARQTLSLGWLPGMISGFSVCRGVGSAEGLARHFEEIPGAGTKKTLLFYDEFAAFVAKAGLGNSTLLPCVNTLFEFNDYQSATKTDPIKLDNAHLSILAASTPETYLRMWTPKYTDIGFLNRLFIVPGERAGKVAIPPSVSIGDRKYIQNELQRTMTFVTHLSSGGPFRMPMEEAALAKYEKWYDSLTGRPAEDALFTKRLDSYSLRFLLLFAINEGRDRVTEDIVDRVVELLNWQFDVRKELAPIDAETRIAKLEEAIRRAIVQGPIGKRDLERKCSKNRYGIGPWDIAISHLIKENELEFDEKSKVYSKKP